MSRHDDFFFIKIFIFELSFQIVVNSHEKWTLKKRAPLFLTRKKKKTEYKKEKKNKKLLNEFSKRRRKTFLVSLQTKKFFW